MISIAAEFAGLLIQRVVFPKTRCHPLGAWIVTLVHLAKLAFLRRNTASVSPLHS